MGGVGFCSVILLFIVPRDQLSWSVVALVVAVTARIAAVPAIAWFLIRMAAIRSSVERYQNGTAAMRRRFEGVGR